MSMLSAQCDELRELATKYDELQVGAVRAVRIPLDTGSVLREAADTICQLRDDLQRANAENADLREDMEAAKHDLSLFSGELVASKAENAKLQASNEVIAEDHAVLCEQNAKLRELLADLIKWCEGPCGGCIDYESCDGVPLFEFWTTTKERARELGVEVE